jgi:glutamate-1-semialdehyde 2,1-aminomutase
MGGGMPMAAFGGRVDIMSKLAPLGNVYQAGTLSGNPLAVAAGLANLDIITQPGFFDCLATQTKKFVNGMKERADKAGIDFSVDSVGGMFGLYFSKEVPTSYAAVTASDIEAFKKFFHLMLDGGVYLAPSAFEAGFLSIAHDDAVLREIWFATEKSFGKMAIL